MVGYLVVEVVVVFVGFDVVVGMDCLDFVFVGIELVGFVVFCVVFELVE